MRLLISGSWVRAPRWAWLVFAFLLAVKWLAVARSLLLQTLGVAENFKPQTSLGGLEPPTFRLTAERANRLRHRDNRKPRFPCFAGMGRLPFLPVSFYGTSPVQKRNLKLGHPRETKKTHYKAHMCVGTPSDWWIRLCQPHPLATTYIKPSTQPCILHCQTFAQECAVPMSPVTFTLAALHGATLLTVVFVRYLPCSMCLCKFFVLLL